MNIECKTPKDNFITRWFRKRAIKKYVRRLGPKLVRNFGRKRYYKPADVKRTAQEGHFAMDYLCYGLATYSCEADFNAYHREQGETCDYNTMRGEVADICFNGDSNFTILDIVGSSVQRSGPGGEYAGEWSEFPWFDGDGGDSGGGDFGCGSGGD